MKAFPCGEGIKQYEYGMDLRDYFAAKAMQQLIQSYGNQGDYLKCAEEAFSFADAMMKAREQ